MTGASPAAVAPGRRPGSETLLVRGWATPRARLGPRPVPGLGPRPVPGGRQTRARASRDILAGPCHGSTCARTPSPTPLPPCGARWRRRRSATTSSATTRPSTRSRSAPRRCSGRRPASSSRRAPWATSSPRWPTWTAARRRSRAPRATWSWTRLPATPWSWGRACAPSPTAPTGRWTWRSSRSRSATRPIRTSRSAASWRSRTRMRTRWASPWGSRTRRRSRTSPTRTACPSTSTAPASSTRSWRRA